MAKFEHPIDRIFMEAFEQHHIDLEAKLIRQEHRLIPLILNYTQRHKKWPKPDDPRNQAASKALLWRIFFSPATISIILSGGILGWFTLYFMRAQNTLIQDQNEKIEIQSNLMEATRRSSQMFIMGEILSDLNKELENKQNPNRKLSRTLIGRIKGLSRAMKPYRYYQNNGLITKPTSPERGQLLIALLESDIHDEDYQDILLYSDFRYADLEGWSGIGEESLEKIDLSHANLRGVFFLDTNLNFVDLSHADIEGAIFEKVDLGNTLFAGVDVSKAKSFEKSIVYSPDWFDEIERQGALGVDSLRSVYYIDTLYQHTYRDVMYSLLKKGVKYTDFREVIKQRVNRL